MCLSRQGLKTFTLTALVVAAFSALLSLSAPALAAQTGLDLVSEAPRRDTPVVLNGRVLAHAQVGNRVFVGGTFTQVEKQDGTVVNQAYIFAYDLGTGIFDDNFRPVLNNSVNALETAPNGNDLYVGGRFAQWDNNSQKRVAKLDAAGNLDTSFNGSANAVVRDLAVTSNRLYLAGDFNQVSGAPRVGFASVTLGTGAIDNGFVFNVENVEPGTTAYARRIVATPNGSHVYGLHFGTHINGFQREALVKINVVNPTALLGNWAVPWSAQAQDENCRQDLRDLAISPDGSFIVVAGQGRDHAPNCDSVIRYETNTNGLVNLTWAARMYSSVFSLAVSDDAVYAAGHFCAAPRNGAAPGGITHPLDITEGPPGSLGTANACNRNDPNDPVNPSVRFPNDAVFRDQMAALNPANGQALDWNPGTNAGVGVFDLTLIDAGLLAGQDNDRFGADIRTGGSGFFTLSSFRDTTGPEVTHTTPTSRSNGFRALQGQVTDPSGVDRVEVEIRNQQTGQFWNGTSWQQGQVRTTAVLNGTTWTVPRVNLNALGDYRVLHWAWDEEGNLSGWTTNPQTIVTIFNGDTSGPTLTHTTPTSRSNGFRAFQGQVTDPSGVDRVEVEIRNQQTGQFWNGTSWQQGQVRTTAVLNGTTWTVPRVNVNAVGQYRVLHWAWDNANNLTGWAANPRVFVSVFSNDTDGPALTHTAPTVRSAGFRTFQGQVTDPSGVDRVEVEIRNQQTGQFWNGTSWQQGQVRTTAVLNGSTWSVPGVNLTAAGQYRILHWAWDDVGNLTGWRVNPKVFVTVN